MPGPTELVLILAIVVIFFGVGKLPEVGSALGKGIRNFRGAVKEGSDEAKAVLADLDVTSDIQDVEEKVSEKSKA
jgi:sec-independent protein translocase protein TatA